MVLRGNARLSRWATVWAFFSLGTGCCSAGHGHPTTKAPLPLAPPWVPPQTPVFPTHHKAVLFLPGFPRLPVYLQADVLSRIFALLSPHEMSGAEHVCRRWRAVGAWAATGRCPPARLLACQKPKAAQANCKPNTCAIPARLQCWTTSSGASAACSPTQPWRAPPALMPPACRATRPLLLLLLLLLRPALLAMQQPQQLDMMPRSSSKGPGPGQRPHGPLHSTRSCTAA